MKAMRRPHPLRRLTAEQVARVRAPDANLRALSREFAALGIKISTPGLWKVKHGLTYQELPA